MFIRLEKMVYTMDDKVRHYNYSCLASNLAVSVFSKAGHSKRPSSFTLYVRLFTSKPRPSN